MIVETHCWRDEHKEKMRLKKTDHKCTDPALKLKKKKKQSVCELCSIFYIPLNDN